MREDQDSGRSPGGRDGERTAPLWPVSAIIAAATGTVLAVGVRLNLSTSAGQPRLTVDSPDIRPAGDQGTSATVLDSEGDATRLEGFGFSRFVTVTDGARDYVLAELTGTQADAPEAEPQTYLAPLDEVPPPDAGLTIVSVDITPPAISGHESGETLPAEALAEVDTADGDSEVLVDGDAPETIDTVAAVETPAPAGAPGPIGFAAAAGPGDTITGTGGDDTLIGTGGHDVIDAGQGDDVVHAGAGDDIIFGGDAGDADGGGKENAKTVDTFTFAKAKAGSVVAGTGPGNIGDSILYSDIATATDGTAINARIIVVDQSDTALDVNLAHSDDFPVYLNAGKDKDFKGESVKFRVEFLDSFGNAVTINSSFTFRDVDNDKGDKEGITVDKSDVNSYAVSGSPPTKMVVSDLGDKIEFSSTDFGNPNNEDLWIEFFFEGQSSLEFEITSRGTSTGYGFDTAEFGSNPVVTDVDASGHDLIYGDAGNDTIFAGHENDTLYGGADNDRLEGDEGADTLFGGAGNDLLDGGEGGDTLYGGDGDDVFTASEGADLAFGGAGNDTFALADGMGSLSVTGGDGLDTLDASALTAPVTVDGGSLTAGGITVDLSGVEKFIGTDGDDAFDFSDGLIDGLVGGLLGGLLGISEDGVIIEAGAGDDTITGTDNGDSISAGAGDDTVDAGAGDDIIDLSGGGANIVDGGAGIDTVDYSSSAHGITVRLDGKTTQQGGGFTDDELASVETITGQTTGQDELDNVEVVKGSEFGDAILGSNKTGDAETIFGGGGDDLIDGQKGDDTIFGGDGDDTLIGGKGDDVMTGGEGADVFVIDNNSGVDTIKDFELGTDKFDFSGVTQRLGGDALNTNDIKILDSVGDGTGDAILVLPSLDSITLEGVSVFDLDPETLESMGFAASSDDTGLQNAFLVDTTKVAEFGAGGGDDMITGGSGAQTLRGGGGADVIRLGGGADMVDGGDDADRIMLADDFDGVTINGGEGGDDRDMLDASAMSQGVTFVATGDESGTISFGTVSVLEGAPPPPMMALFAPPPPTTTNAAAPDQTGQYSGIETFNGSSSNDTFDLTATSTGKSVTAGDGDDTVLGGTGNDVFQGEGGDDSIDGGDGDDFLDGNDGNDAIAGGAGADTLYGETGDDTLEGGSGADTIYGGDDADRIVLGDGFGTDAIYGGEGGTDSDVLDLGALTGDADVTLTGDEAGTLGSGADSATFEGIESIQLGSGADSVDASATTGGVTILAGDGGDSLTGGSGGDSLAGEGGEDVIDGGAGDDDLWGGAGNDSVAGGTGNDTIGAAAGNDTVSGGDGNDTIDAGAGNDTLIGGAGNDTLTGGTGDDTFVLGDGDDTITDFTVGEDLVDSSALSDVGNALTDQDGTVTADEVTVTGGGGSDQVLTFPSGETVTVPDGTIDTSTPQTQFASLVAIGVPPCFAPGTLIATPDGQRKVEDLAPGDLVLTADHGAQPIRWIGRREQDFGCDDHPDKPILIAAGSLGAGVPGRDLTVSPQHRMVLSGAVVRAMFGAEQVLALAKGLTGLKGVRRMKGKRQATYYALLLDRHEVLFAEGAATESFRPGPTVLAGFTAAQRAEIFAVYPGLADDPEEALGPPARPILKRREVRDWIRASARSDAGDLEARRRETEFARWDADLADEAASHATDRTA